MRREEKREKMYFLQMSSKFFEEIAVKRLVLTGGNDALVIYLRIWCKSLETGGVIELTGMGMEPAEEIALMIDCPAVPQVASVLTMCQAYGLITVGNGDSGKIINFSLTEDYTRAWTREAIMRRNDKTNRIEATEAPAMIEAKEETEAERKKREKKEAAKQKKAEEEAAADEMFERLWKQYPKKKGKERVKPAAKMKLYKCGEERCQRALDTYKAERTGKDDTYTLYGCNFFNKDIYDYMDMPATKPQTQPQAPIMITDQMVDSAIYGDDLTKENWDSKKAAYMPELQAAIEKALFK